MMSLVSDRGAILIGDVVLCLFLFVPVVGKPVRDRRGPAAVSGNGAIFF
jgi:hypothetical protein